MSNIYVSELSASKHVFSTYHFCRGNNSKRKSRFGLIQKGSGTYIYLGEKLKVTAGDVVFIPENICCYSEWHGTPEIEVLYLSCFMHYETFKYEPQTLTVDDTVKHDILQIAELLTGGQADVLEAYSRFYKLLQPVFAQLQPSHVEFDKTLQTAIEYCMAHYNEPFSVAELAKTCCVSESTLYHLFKRALGLSPVSFLNSVRINIAIEHLEKSEYAISTISQLVGFRSENHFRKVFAEFTGTTPLKYKKRTHNG